MLRDFSIYFNYEKKATPVMLFSLDVIFLSFPHDQHSLFFILLNLSLTLIYIISNMIKDTCFFMFETIMNMTYTTL